MTFNYFKFRKLRRCFCMKLINYLVRPGLLLVMMLHAHFTKGQQQIADIVYLDSVMVSAQKSGFSVEEFIELVVNDESFYQAFKNLRYTDYMQSTTMSLEDGNRSPVTYQATHRQSVGDSCRTLALLSESSSERFYRGRKDKIRYYTASMYHRIFGQTGTFCHEHKPIAPATSSDGGMEGHIDALKQLIFSPGTPADVPFLKSRTAIFSSRMRKRYTYHIHSRVFHTGDTAYVFEVQLRPDFQQVDDNRTLVKSMVTWFSKDDFQVLGRTYRLSQRALLYDFEVEMNISLERQSEIYLPGHIQYQGWWNIPTRRREKGSFKIDFDYSPFPKE